MNFKVNARSVVLAAAAALSTAAFAAPAMAGTVTFSNITGTWSNPAPGGVVNYSGNGTNNAKARWGDDYPQSGYTFQATSPINVAVGGPGNYGPITIGTFTHNNWPIDGDSITSIKLAIKATITIDGVNQGVRTFNYQFSHWETDNNVPGYPGTCANGQSEWAPINANGCADRVKVAFLDTSEMFNVGGNLYTLDFSGFLNGGSPVSEFWTKEKADNSAQFQASIKLVQAAVPEPTTWAMMIVGFGAAGAMIRNRRRFAVAA